MQPQSKPDPYWAALTVWGVVNAVNALQTLGFLSRVRTGTMAINQLLGLAIALLAIPSALALFAFLRSKAHWFHWIGSLVFLVFLAFMGIVDYIRPLEFRSPPRPAILIPYLVLFFGSIVLMGMPMFRISRKLWLVTLLTSVLLVTSMGLAMLAGVG